MKRYEVYPKIADVEAQAGRKLLVRFRNGITKLYDCNRVLKRYPAFEPLRDSEALFRRVRADAHGYGVVWNDELDLAESELWIRGKVVREERPAFGIEQGEKTAKRPRSKGRSPRRGRLCPRVKSVRPEDGYRLRLRFDNGEQRLYDCGPLLTHGVFRELRDPARFRTVRAWMGTVQWAGGQDICPDTLYMDSIPVAPRGKKS